MYFIISTNLSKYCGIIIARGGPMFVVFVGNPCPVIYIPMNVYTSICLICIKIISNLLPTKLRLHEPGKFWLPMNIDPYE